MQNELLNILEQRFENLQNVRNLASNDDEKLLAFLLSEQKFSRFFMRIKDAMIFKKDAFLQFLDLRILGKSYTALRVNAPHLAQKIDKNLKLFKKDSSVVLSFPFKDCVLKGAQTKDDKKTDEIFFNEILASDEIDVLKSPKVLFNFELIGGGE